MSKHSDLLGFYSEILQTVGPFDATGDGLLSYKQGDTVLPVTIDKKRLVLPVKAVLQSPDWDKIIGFHPFSEEITQSPSPVLNNYKLYWMLRHTETIKALAVGLAELAHDIPRHKKLPAKLSKYTDKAPDADEKCVDTLNKVLNTISEAPERRLVNIFMKNGGEGGVLRSSMISFPILDDLDSDDLTTLAGVKMPRKTKDKTVIRAIFEFILGDAEERKQYSAGSADDNAPYLHSLLLANAKLAKRLDNLITLYEKYIPSLSDYKFTLGWTELVEDKDAFNKFANTAGAAVPPLPGNRGKEKDSVKPADAGKVFGNNNGSTKLDLPWEDSTTDKVEEAPRRSYAEPEPERKGGQRTISLKDRLRGGSSSRDSDDRGYGRDRDSRSSRDDRGGRFGRGSRGNW